MLKLIVFVQSFTRRLKKDHVNAYSAQSAYFIILSAIPFIMFILTLLRFLPLDSQNFTDGLLSLIPAETHSLAVTIINEIYGKTTGTLLSISIIILLWTACKGIMALTNGLNAAYEIDETRNYFRLRIQADVYKRQPNVHCVPKRKEPIFFFHRHFIGIHNLFFGSQRGHKHEQG